MYYKPHRQGNLSLSLSLLFIKGYLVLYTSVTEIRWKLIDVFNLCIQLIWFTVSASNHIHPKSWSDWLMVVFRTSYLSNRLYSSSSSSSLFSSFLSSSGGSYSNDLPEAGKMSRWVFNWPISKWKKAMSAFKYFRYENVSGNGGGTSWPLLDWRRGKSLKKWFIFVRPMFFFWIESRVGL